MSSYFFFLGRVPSLVFEEDVEDLGLVLQTLRVPQQLGQGAVVDGAVSVSGDAALRAHHHLRDLQGWGGGEAAPVESWREGEAGGGTGEGTPTRT